MKNLNKTLIIIFSAVILIAAAVSVMLLASPRVAAADSSAGTTVIQTPGQTKAEWPPAVPDPRGNWVKLPDTPNLAEGKPVKSGEVTEIYSAANVVDGDTTSYWESQGIPAEITIDLQAVYNISYAGVCLNPSPVWEARTQTFEVLLSTDGENFTVAAAEALYQFTPDTGNIVLVNFDTTAAQYVRLNFTAKSSGRSKGAQAAEIVVYE
jgi:hypothetical protein